MVLSNTVLCTGLYSWQYIKNTIDGAVIHLRDQEIPAQHREAESYS